MPKATHVQPRKRCLTCKKLKRISYFRSQPRSPDGRSETCIICLRQGLGQVKCAGSDRRLSPKEINRRRAVRHMYQTLGARGYDGKAHEIPLVGAQLAAVGTIAAPEESDYSEVEIGGRS